MKRILILGYGVACYLIFLATFLYAIGFVGNLLVPTQIDSGEGDAPGEAFLIDTLLLGLFALPHSVMARQRFKQWWTRIIPPSAERSTFVLVSSLLLLLLFWQWRPVPDIVWNVSHPTVRLLLWGLFWVGWGIVLLATFLINHFDLFGLRQVYLHAAGRPYSPLPLTVPGLYRYVRHPIMLGFLIAFWATPTMTAGHLLFAAATTAYILVALQFEERDLVRFHGPAYEQYQQQVSMLLPLPRRLKRQENV